MSQIDLKNDELKIRNLLPKVAAGTADFEDLLKLLVPYFYKEVENYDEAFREQKTIYDVNHLLPQGVKCRNFFFSHNDKSEHDASIYFEYQAASDFSSHNQVMAIVEKLAEHDGIITSVNESMKSSMIRPTIKAKDRHNFEVELEEPVI